uniref:Uncharacterized protein n=1 Tax=Prymnesium polylepis TaxID=72548 RepID=A0A7S4HEN9_9EUKA|mmetsp:Transcript_14299/g.36283  ORF Transcript_14299/g.36283 Transcript_14299/m.36283 type:complete len:120 (+) Transcript_14299:217-576(+)
MNHAHRTHSAHPSIYTHNHDSGRATPKMRSHASPVQLQACSGGDGPIAPRVPCGQGAVTGSRPRARVGVGQRRASCSARTAAARRARRSRGAYATAIWAVAPPTKLRESPGGSSSSKCA